MKNILILTLFLSFLNIQAQSYSVNNIVSNSSVPLLNGANYDEPSTAQLLTVNAVCTYTTYDNTNATSSLGIPPPGCGGAIMDDVWFKIGVPVSGSLEIDFEQALNSFPDGCMAAYSGSPNALTVIGCNDDYGGGGSMPHLVLNNQTPGDTIYIRFWKWAGGTGDFDLCVTEPPYFMISPKSLFLSSASGTDTIHILASSIVTWSVSDNASWLTINPAGGTGNGDVVINYSASGNSSRSAVVTGIAAGMTNQHVNINQSSFVKADFDISNLLSCVNSSISFTNTSSNATSYMWLVDGVQKSTASNFNYVFTAEGSYNIKLMAIGTNFTDSVTKNVLIGANLNQVNAGTDINICENENITFNNTPVEGIYGCNTNCDLPTYCNSASANDNTEYIIGVKLDSMENVSTNKGFGYQDNSSSIFSLVNVDSSYLITVTAFTTGSWVEYVDVFIDWNRNGVFDEPVISLGTATFVGAHDFVGIVSPPANAVLGKTLMRVIMKYGQPIAGGCINNYGFGETEDYTIELVDYGNINHSWTGPNSYTSVEETPIIYNVPTSYTGNYVLEVTNIFGCSSTDTVAVNVNTGSSVNMASIPSTCQGNADIQLTQGSPTGGSYSGSYVSNGYFSPSSSGVGTFDIVYHISSLIGCAGSDTNTITVYALPTVSFTGLSTSVCENTSSATLIGQPTGGSFSGLGIELGNQFNPSLAGAGIRQIMYDYTDTNSCSNSSNQSVVVLDLPIVNAGNDTIVNSGNTAYLHGSINNMVGTANIMWSPAANVVNSTNINTNTNALVTSTEFTLNVADNTTNCVGSDKIMVSVTGGSLALTMSIDNTTICAGDTLQLTAVVSGGAGSISYQWFANGSPISDTVYNPKRTPAVSTWFKVIISDNSSMLSDSIFVEVKPIPIVSFNIASDICESANPILMTNIIPTGGSFSGAGVVGVTFDPQMVGQGLHDVTYSYSDSYSCFNSITKSIEVRANPIVNMASIASICNSSQSIVLNAGTPVGGVYSGAGVSGVLFDPLVAGSGVHMIYYSYINQYFCQAEDSASIAVSSSPIAEAGFDMQILANSTATISGSASGGSGTYSYQWVPDTMVVNPSAASTNTVSLSSSQLYKLIVTDDQSQCNDSDNVIVNVVGGALSVIVDIQQISICQGDSIELNAVVTGGDGSYTYSWTSSPGSFTSTLQNPKVAPNVTTAFIVQVTSANNTASGGKFIIVDSAPQLSLPVDTSVCDNSSITISADGGYSNYQWSNGYIGQDLTVNGNQLLNENNVLSVIVTNTTGCVNMDTIDVLRLTSPHDMLGNDTALYSCNDITLDAGDNMVSYLWSTSDTIQTVYFPQYSLPDTVNYYWVDVVNQQGCFGTDTITIYYLVCESINQSTEIGYNLSVYPNPASKKLTVSIESDFADAAEIVIFDNQARQVFSRYIDVSIGDNIERVDVSNLSRGMYYVYIKGRKISRVKKLIVN